MKIVVIGGTGHIGSKIVSNLRRHGHDAIAAAPSTGVDTITGQGVAGCVAGAQAVVDVTNPTSWADDAVMAFFTTSEKRR